MVTQSNTNSRDEALKRAQLAAESGNVSQAASILKEILREFPKNPIARNLMRQLFQGRSIKDRKTFLDHWLEAMEQWADESRQRAAQGWKYLLTVDSAFNDPTLSPSSDSTESITSIPPNEASQPDQSSTQKHLLLNQDAHPENVGIHARELIDKLVEIPTLSECWLQAMALCQSTDPLLTEDSFSDIAEDQLRAELIKSQTGSALNVVVVGAGPVGLAFTNAMKLAFGSEVNILVVDKRVSCEHRKEPYSRHWLTHLRPPLMNGMLDPSLVKVLARLGQPGFLGTTIALLETLLLLSNRSQDVKFLFQSEPDLAFVEHADTNLLVDASGGRLDLSEPHWQAGPFRENSSKMVVNFNIAEGFGSGHASHGITKYIRAQEQKVSLLFKNGHAQPASEKGNLRSAMFKLTSIPISLYQELIEFTKSRNDDSLFYVWPGKLHNDINEILLLTNLNQESLRFLQERVRTNTDLKSFFDTCAGNFQGLDYRIIELLRLLKSRISDLSKVGIEVPFIYQPKLRFPGEGYDHFYGRPILAIGDTVYNGHPKVGNGLSAHLEHISRLLDEALFAGIMASQLEPSDSNGPH
ncbi:MAG: hypothetical protein JJ921_10380 [Pseudomonadales bacterium]|nr:hypothetical protein [Pseudomonadales bacterium]MBO7004647.1 hypothetical protein [Pseudomonadales bacterium]